MNYIEVKITTTHDDVERVCAMLSPLCSGFIIDDPQDVYEFSQEKTTKWDYIDDALLGNPDRDVTVTLYVDDSEDGKAQIEDVKRVLAEAKLTGNMETSLAVNGVQSEDWENNWKQYYKPFTVGQHLLIRPSWEEIDNKEGRKVLTIDPASSFGTGSHATTRLCLNEIDGIDCEGKTVLDVGCGSGILMTAMLLMGAGDATGCDIEENAVNTTAENILKNNISEDKFSVHLGDLLSNRWLNNKLSEKKYDLICANIVADVLKNMCTTLLSWLKDDGTLIISGIIEERKDEVKAHYEENGAVIEKMVVKDGWAMIRISKKI